MRFVDIVDMTYTLIDKCAIEQSPPSQREGFDSFIAVSLLAISVIRRNRCRRFARPPGETPLIDDGTKTFPVARIAGA